MRSHSSYWILNCLFLFSIGSNVSVAASSSTARSVYQISPAVDGAIIGGSSLISLIPHTLSSNWISPHCPCDSSQVNALDRIAIGNHNEFAATVSDISLGAVLIGLPLLDWLDLGTNQALLEDLVVYSEVLSVSGAFVTLSKNTIQRPIPLVYSGHNSADDPKNYLSFYSGHSTLAFAALTTGAMTSHLRHRRSLIPWIVAIGMGGLIAYERVASGRHFPSDAIVGALSGTAQGILIPYFHSRPENSSTFKLDATGHFLAVAWTQHF